MSDTQRWNEAARAFYEQHPELLNALPMSQANALAAFPVVALAFAASTSLGAAGRLLDADLDGMLVMEFHQLRKDFRAAMRAAGLNDEIREADIEAEILRAAAGPLYRQSAIVIPFEPRSTHDS